MQVLSFRRAPSPPSPRGSLCWLWLRKHDLAPLFVHASELLVQPAARFSAALRLRLYWVTTALRSRLYWAARIGAQ
eukprot:3327881-Rhodomonas_salina.1